VNSRIVKTVLLGPEALRYRGGISQFTSRLALELSRSSDLRFFTWKELYPRILISREREDSGAREKTPLLAHPIISYSKPWTWRHLANAIAQEAPDLIFLTWSHPIHAPIYLALIRMLRKRVRGEIVLICHNVIPHEYFPFAQTLARKVFRSVDRVIVHSHEEKSRLKALAVTTECTELFMPRFDLFEAKQLRTQSKRKRLLFFGSLRGYKGLDVLLRALPLVRNSFPHIVLKIAGEPFYQSSSALLRLFRKSEVPLVELIDELNLRESVELDLRYIPDQEIPELFSQADAVVYPFRSVTGSASLSLALALGKPVVASRVGDLESVIKPGINGLLVSPNNPVALAEGICSLLKQLPTESEVVASTAEFSWSRYCQQALMQDDERRKYA